MGALGDAGGAPPGTDRVDVLVYAPGGGNGHRLRALGLAEALARRGACPLVVTKGEPAPGREPLPRFRDADEARSWLSDLVARVRPSAWITDTFPEGPAGELNGIDLPPAALLARLRRGPRVALRRGADRYRSVIDLEPHLGWWQEDSISAGPVLPRVPRWEAPERVDLLVVADDDDLASLGERVVAWARARGWSVAFARHGRLELPGERTEAAYPRVLERVRPRALVGPAGYHLVYEALSLGIPHVAVPRPRRFDDQARRAEAVALRPTSPRDLLRLVETVVCGAEGAVRPALSGVRVRAADALVDALPWIAPPQPER